MLLVATLLYHTATGFMTRSALKSEWEHKNCLDTRFLFFDGQDSSMQNLCIKLAKDIAVKRKAANLSSFSVPSLSHTPRINQSVSK